MTTGRIDLLADRKSERQDAQDDGGLETLRRDGYMERVQEAVCP